MSLLNHKPYTTYTKTLPSHIGGLPLKRWLSYVAICAGASWFSTNYYWPLIVWYIVSLLVYDDLEKPYP